MTGRRRRRAREEGRRRGGAVLRPCGKRTGKGSASAYRATLRRRRLNVAAACDQT
ncbi:hypothetical protein BURMUCF1_0413 [Burkholderia multivorans ATCC BAA-247]|uniref:Uncharacterized protein n=1 Tax=Burkholderia multivorans CGD2 TaxID=513052 RepID=B9C0J6_9BURK|nr:hypothetical protein BURMUCGD2_3061 [Burkholderia multivorans CGD2]EEE10254.1 hypothetical protein BURMUCGD2M_3145 [Burkholderia multivorans CGD2M]EJO58469.1 hypothetical protein BURMUCF1_0413 [Burkholderia multivorans ATCC BAA-247]